jgi:3-isopropylmalate/(R)-2-methylmalate dehydratase small subunit
LRNCINVGLPSLPCPGILNAFNEGDIGEVDWTTGAVHNLTQDSALQGQPLPQVLQDIVTAGGVEAVLRAGGYLSNR